MHRLLYRLYKADCDAISSIIKDDEGVLEVTAPKMCSEDEIKRYLSSVNARQISGLIRNHKKHNKAFRKVVNDMINKYIKEYELPITSITLRLSLKTNKMLNYGVSVYGWMSEGYLSLPAFLEYYPAKLVDTIVRCGVACIAVEYEHQMHSVKECRSILEPVVGTNEVRIRYVPVKVEDKYTVPFDNDELDMIIGNYLYVASYVANDNKVHPMLYMDILG